MMDIVKSLIRDLFGYVSIVIIAIILSIIGCCFSGCVWTSIKSDNISANRIAFLYPFELGSFSYNPTDGGESTAASITAAAVSAAVESAK